LINQFLGGDSNISIKLIRDVTRSNGDKEFVDVTVNDILYTELSSFTSNKALVDKLTNDLLHTNEFCNFIYMDDMVESTTTGRNKMLPGSRFFAEFKGDIMNGYVAPISGITYSIYEIDETKISGSQDSSKRGQNQKKDPRLTAIKTTISNINNLIKSYQLGDQIKIDDSLILNRLISESPENIVAQLLNDVNSRNMFSKNN
jgi:hypothetical protein